MSRFSEPQDPDFEAINTSLGFDRRLWPHDVAQSRAHARMLAAQGIISTDDRDQILAGLDAVEAERAGGAFSFDEGDEDIHMAVERRLTEIVGPVGGRLHTARSRNDQGLTDLATYVRERCADARRAVSGGGAGDAGRWWCAGLRAGRLPRAGEHADSRMPGYTRLQRAQPVYLGHHLL